MEIKGKPGDTVWIRATLRKIVVTESGVEYYANPTGTDSRFSFKAEDIKIDPMSKSEALTKALEEVCDAAKAQVYDAMLVQPEGEQQKKFQEVIDSVDAGKKKRGRPRKATVEDLMHKADQALAESPLYEDEKRRKKDGR
jgi:AT hook motif.